MEGKKGEEREKSTGRKKVTDRKMKERRESRWETRENWRKEGGCEDERVRGREERRQGELRGESEQSAKQINNQLTGITK